MGQAGRLAEGTTSKEEAGNAEERQVMIYKRGKCKLNPDGKCKKCGRRSTCGVYWYKFMWQGKLIRESTKQANDKVARNMESAHRTSLAKGEVGIREKKPAPTLALFLTNRILPWAEAAFSDDSQRKNLKWYRNESRALKNFKPLANASLDGITGELVSAFSAHRLREGLQVATVNSSIRVLRRALNLAVEWKLIDAAPKLNVLPGARRRERVISTEEEAKYLAAAWEPLAAIATVLADTGMRPEECFRMMWEQISWSTAKNGVLLVTHGKTRAARRTIPMTARVRNELENRWIAASRPKEGYVWPARTRSGHVEPNSVYGQHLKALTASGVRPFVLYSLRHTFLTRLGESGCDAWTLARIAGHSSIAVSSHYVHPSEDRVLEAISRLPGHKIGHSEIEPSSADGLKLLTSDLGKTG
jgi:integrase